MRTKEEIMKDAFPYRDNDKNPSDKMKLATLEVLIDIRDVLAKQEPKTWCGCTIKKLCESHGESLTDALKKETEETFEDVARKFPTHLRL